MKVNALNSRFQGVGAQFCSVLLDARFFRGGEGYIFNGSAMGQQRVSICNYSKTNGVQTGQHGSAPFFYKTYGIYFIKEC